jgi:CHAT domain-containing protein
VEPGLILTPPATATLADDGYLSSSEILGFKLNADWVVLSACNTAGGDASNSDAFSGLARAFFYAGARALLVSHWPVRSDAAVAITTGAIDAMKSHTDIGRAEGLRRSLSALIAKGGEYAHPSAWAPFVLVGNGSP